MSKRAWRLGAVLVLVPVFAGVLARAYVSARLHRDSVPRIEVSLSERRLKLIENGKTVKTYGIAIGKPSFPTPTGSFRVGRIVWNPTWVPPASPWARGERPRAAGERGNPMQGVKIYFRDPAYYIHGTNNPASIGAAASHGCIRMQKSEAEDLARRLMQGAGAGRGSDWYSRVISGNTTTEVRLPRAVAMIIRG